MLWAVVIVGLVALGYWLLDAAKTQEAARPGEAVSIMSSDHVAFDDTFSDYNSNPPTSGPHAGAAPWGFNENEVPDMNAVHNLEHGGIWISYNNIDDDQVAQLEAIAEADRLSVLVSPRSANDSPIAVTSWGRLMKLDTVDEALINEFIRENKNKSPEPLAR